MVSTRCPAAIACLAVSTGVGLAQQFEIPWHTLEGGGASSAGVFELRGVVGQADASSPADALTGGSFTLVGGFLTGQAAPCVADLAPPLGLLDLADVTTFINAFAAQDPIADLAPPVGLFDLADVIEFVSAFNAGCP